MSNFNTDIIKSLSQGISIVFIGYWLELICDDLSGMIIPIYDLY